MTHVPPEVQRAFEDRYQVPILLTYGATEFGGVVVQMTEQLAAEWGQRKLGSVGRKLRRVEGPGGRSRHRRGAARRQGRPA